MGTTLSPQVTCTESPNWTEEAEALAMRTGVLLLALTGVLELARTSILDEERLLPLFELSAEIHDRARRLSDGGVR